LEIEPFLRALVDNGGSDLHLKAGSPPLVRIRGQLIPLDTAPLTAADSQRIVLATMRTEEEREEFLVANEHDYALSMPGLGRFRANAFRARGSVGMVLRHVVDQPYTLEELNMPGVVARLALEPRGLVLVTGPTGSGKSTTLAAMVDQINENRRVHVLTIEDPIEYLHRDKKSSINQREIRTDTIDFGTALRAAMRQDPDVILIGEMRDVETVRAALQAAETGHLVLSTLHTTDATETVTRIIDFFPPHEQKQVRLSLAESLRGIVCQRLMPSADGVSRIPCMEIAVGTPRIAEAIADPEKTTEIETIVADGDYYGMQTFQQSLVRLVLDGLITVATAKDYATDVANLDLELRRQGVEV
jgi:twitching motility protein PilT